MSKEIKTVTAVGMGALGILFGTPIFKALGDEGFSFLMDEERKEKYKDQVFTENGEPRKYRLVSDKELQAEGCPKSDLVIVAVKYKALQSAIELLKSAGCIGDETIIISVMNGIDSEEIIGAEFGMEKMVFCVAQGMDAMKFGNDLIYTKMGALFIGVPKGFDTENLESVIKFFDEVGMPYIDEKDIIYRMWAKFMLNVGVNQTCMAYGTTYQGVIDEGEAHDTFVAAMEEVVAIANKEGVPLGQKEVDEYISILKTLDPEGTPSMGQDRINKKPSEVDMFAGKVIELGKKHDIPTPANEKLFNMAKEIEKEYV